MGKDDFSNQPDSSQQQSRRQREEFEGIDQESREDGAEMERNSAHSNLGIGDEKNPIREKEEE
jgi:hypothetical protein